MVDLIEDRGGKQQVLRYQTFAFECLAKDAFSRPAPIGEREMPERKDRGQACAQIGGMLQLRVQVAPMTKIGGFLSDAYYAEWTYGKLQVVKKAMAAALARLVEAGFYEEEEVPPPELVPLELVTGWSRLSGRPAHHEGVALFGGWRIGDIEKRKRERSG